MSLIECQAAYKIGIRMIDEQRQQLVKLINQLERTVNGREAESQAEQVLVKLVDYVRYYFAEEEKLMAEHNYAHTDQHAQLHQQFVHKVADFLKKLKTDGSISAQDLLSFLKSWLIDHILREDTKLRSLDRSVLSAKYPPITYPPYLISVIL